MTGFAAPTMSQGVSDERYRELLEAYLKTSEGREKLLQSMMNVMSRDAVVYLEQGQWRPSALTSLRRLKESVSMLIAAIMAEGGDADMGRYLNSPRNYERVLSQFCQKCGVVSELGDGHDPDECVVVEVLSA